MVGREDIETALDKVGFESRIVQRVKTKSFSKNTTWSGDRQWVEEYITHTHLSNIKRGSDIYTLDNKQC